MSTPSIPLVLPKHNRAPWLGALSLLIAACATRGPSAPPQPLENITECNRFPRKYVTRPSGPRTPPAMLLSPGCDPFRTFELPSPLSNAPSNSSGFKAGFAKKDITPAPGLGMLGYGTEARAAMGFRNRLHARAMVLESDGRVVAFVVVDLDAVSTILHRETAKLVHAATNGAIGADRLILSATHTHSAPGNFLTGWPLNLIGSGVPGYDHAFVQWLSRRIAATVQEAYEQRLDARAAWAIQNVWGYTRNRSIPAFVRNQDTLPFPISPSDIPPPAGLGDKERRVNPRWAMLRVDVRDGTEWSTGGSLNIFAIHGTVVPAGNELYDADIQGVVARRLEEQLGGIHLMANSTEGDVSPAYPPEARCPLPARGRYIRPEGPRTPRGRIDWVENTAEENASCLSVALETLERLGANLATRAAEMYEGLGEDLAALSVRRNFETVHLTGPEGQRGGLCGRPQAGTALTAGAEDGMTRFKGWRILGLWSMGADWGEDATAADPLNCQSPKRVVFPPLQTDPIGALQYPEWTQFAVVQVGDVWLGTVPAEATTVAGRQMLAALRRGVATAMNVDEADLSPDRFAILGLANGYLNYVTTWDEYQEQRYEGGSTLYGPHSARFMAERLEGLASSIGVPNPDSVGNIEVRPGPDQAHLNPATEEKGPPEFLADKVYTACRPDLVTVAWIDSIPGRFQPAHDTMIQFESNGMTVNDGQTSVEVRMGKEEAGGQRWMAQWRPTTPLPDNVTVTVEFPRWERSVQCTASRG